MSRTRYIWSIAMLLGLIHIDSDVTAQSPQFSQFYANQMLLNPAFTGNTTYNRLAGNYRYQWPGVGKAFNSYALGYDYNWASKNIASSVAILFVYGFNKVIESLTPWSISKLIQAVNKTFWYGWHPRCLQLVLGFDIVTCLVIPSNQVSISSNFH